MNSMNTRAMLSTLSIKQYAARKYDKKATREIAQTHGTNENVGRYNKNLLPADAASYKAIATAAGAARIEFYKNTLPWLDDGARVLPSTNYLSCVSEMRKRTDAFELTISPFIVEYPLLKARAKAALNGLYREEDYPTVDKLKAAFKMNLRFFPLPDAADFRADIRQEDVDAIKQQIDFDTKSSIAKAMEEPYKRLFDGVAHMASRLSESKTCACRACKGRVFQGGEFKDTLVSNLVDLCDTLPRLNLTGDPQLTASVEEVKAALTGFSAGALRDNQTVRTTLAARAEEIACNLRVFYAPAA